MYARRWKLQPAHVAALVIAVTSCGRPTVREIRRYKVVIDEVSSGATPGDVAVLIHRADCPAEQKRLTVNDRDRETAACLRKLAVGSSVEHLLHTFRFPPLSCKVDLPDNMLGPCVMSGATSLRTEFLGTPCPPPPNTAPSGG